jgi:hypothetical protein
MANAEWEDQEMLSSSDLATVYSINYIMSTFLCSNGLQSLFRFDIDLSCGVIA